MKKTDELDRKRAAAYAWGQVPPGDEEAPASEGGAKAKDGEPASGEQDDSAFQVLREKAARVCAAIAEGVERAWASPPDEQVRLVEKLILQADELGVGFSAMQSYPLANVRLLRLGVRLGDRLSPEVREALRGTALWSDASHPEIVDLLIEVAEAEDEELGDALALSLHTLDDGEIARLPGATARFARLLDESPSFITRRLATDWLRLGATRETVPALRRALRLPHFGLRYRAFDLLERRFPDAIDAADLVFLVEEAVFHPPPERCGTEEMSRALAYFPERLESALVRVRPAGAAELLLRIVELRCTQRYFRLQGFDQAWAMGVLAAAYPEIAAPVIDERMLHVEWDRRTLAVVGAGKLRDDLAWPRLRSLAADSVPEIAESAREQWLERRGELCPIDELAGVEAWLFEGPPDERTLSRLAVLRRAPLDARAAMIEVLFGEAPDRAALALLLFAGLDSAVWERRPRAGLPKSRREYVGALVERFGAPAVRGVCALARRYPEGRWNFLDALGELALDGALPEEARGFVIDVALTRLAGAPRPEYTTLSTLARLGMPPGAFDRVWAASQDPEVEWHVRSVASDALATLPEGEARLARAVARAIEAADAAGDPPALTRAIEAGLPSRVPSAIDRAERVIRDLGPATPGDTSVTSLVEACVNGLKEIERLPPDFERRALATPGTNAFCAAVKKVRLEAEPWVKAALRAALDQPEPVSSAEAADALLWLGVLTWQSPELPAILDRAPLLQRAELLAFVLHRTSSGKPWWPWIESVLCATDPAVLRIVDRLGLASGLEDCHDEMRALLPRVPTADARAILEEEVEDAMLASYWQDEDDDDDSEEDDGDGSSGDEDGADLR